MASKAAVVGISITRRSVFSQKRLGMWDKEWTGGDKPPTFYRYWRLMACKCFLLSFFFSLIELEPSYRHLIVGLSRKIPHSYGIKACLLRLRVSKSTTLIHCNFALQIPSEEPRKLVESRPAERPNPDDTLDQ